MPWFQDFSDDVVFLGAGLSHSETICFSEARRFLTQTHQKAHGLQVGICVHDLQGKVKNSGLPKAGRYLSNSDLNSRSTMTKPPVEDGSAILFEMNCHLYT